MSSGATSSAGKSREKDREGALIPGSLRLAVAPVALFIILVAGLYLLNIDVTCESQALLTMLNILFCASASSLIVYLAARSYLATGSRAVLVMGCGALAFGVTYLLAGLL